MTSMLSEPRLLRSGQPVLSGISIRAVPDRSHRTPSAVRARQVPSRPACSAPETGRGVNVAAERAGSELIPERFSDASPAFRSLFAPMARSHTGHNRTCSIGDTRLPGLPVRTCARGCGLRLGSFLGNPPSPACPWLSRSRVEGDPGPTRGAQLPSKWKKVTLSISGCRSPPGLEKESVTF